jgi:hypothetical protein
LACVAATLAGCVTAQPVLRLTPRDQDVVWVGGSPVVGKTGVNVRVATAFARDYDGRIGFRVEVENRTAQPLLIDHRVFSFATCVRQEGVGTEECAPARLAINPEKVILEMDIMRSRQQAANTNEARFHTAMFLLDATVGVAAVTSGDGHAAADFGRYAEHDAHMMDATHARESRQVSAYELERANWTTDAFRKTTIFPGQAAAGLVFTERDVNAKTVWLLIHINNETFSFPFNQVVYVPRPDGVVERR